MHVDSTNGTPTAAELARCLACAAALDGQDVCPSCGRAYPSADGILDAIDLPLTGTNRIAAAFYDGPGWGRFRHWERLFLALHGGQKQARMQILRHLPAMPYARVLEVGIGDGENLPLLPSGWRVYGVDIARSRLEACRLRFPEMSGRLAWAEGEALPFPDATFDAAFSVGGFNYVRDHAAVLRELRRVVLPGATALVADEIPTLHHFTVGHWIGWPGLTAWFLRRTGVDAEFAEMVLSHRAALDAIARSVWPGHRRYRIWNRLGYCLVDDEAAGEVPRCP